MAVTPALQLDSSDKIRLQVPALKENPMFGTPSVYSIVDTTLNVESSILAAKRTWFLPLEYDEEILLTQQEQLLKEKLQEIKNTKAPNPIGIVSKEEEEQKEVDEDEEDEEEEEEDEEDEEETTESIVVDDMPLLEPVKTFYR